MAILQTHNAAKLISRKNLIAEKTKIIENECTRVQGKDAPFQPWICMILASFLFNLSSKRIASNQVELLLLFLFL